MLRSPVIGSNGHTYATADHDHTYAPSNFLGNIEVEMITEHYVIDCEDIKEIDELIQGENAKIYELDGREMTNSIDMDKVLKEKLGFEYESRNNMDALLDSISNLELDFKNIKKIYIIIRNSYAFLNRTHLNYKRAILDTFEDAGERWSEAINLNEWWDRDPIDFRVILAP